MMGSVSQLFNGSQWVIARWYTAQSTCTSYISTVTHRQVINMNDDSQTLAWLTYLQAYSMSRDRLQSATACIVVDGASLYHGDQLVMNLFHSLKSDTIQTNSLFRLLIDSLSRLLILIQNNYNTFCEYDLTGHIIKLSKQRLPPDTFLGSVKIQAAVNAFAAEAVCWTALHDGKLTALHGPPTWT